jgi:hypothetical protein
MARIITIDKPYGIPIRRGLYDLARLYPYAIKSIIIKVLFVKSIHNNESLTDQNKLMKGAIAWLSNYSRPGGVLFGFPTRQATPVGFIA